MTAPSASTSVQAAVLGPTLEARGGISTVNQLWLASAAWGACEIEFIETMTDAGSPARRSLHMVRQQAHFVRRLAAGWRPDLVHVHLSYFTSFYRKLIYIEEALAVGLPVVIHVHAPDLEGFAAAHAVHAQAMKRAFRRVDRVVVLSHAMAATVRQLAGPDVRIEVIYNPVRVADFGGRPRAATAPPVCLFMGIVGDRKGTFDLARSIPAALEQAPGARFVFGGNGEVDALRTLLDELGVARSCDVLGWISGDDKRAAFDQATVYCLPSYHEGLPMSILEAMAGGLPVVSTPIAGIPEAVIDGETGYLVAPGDTPALARRLGRLLSDGAHARALGAAGAARAGACFDVDVVVAQVASLWRTILAERA